MCKHDVISINMMSQKLLLLEASNKWPLNANCQIAPKTIQLLIQTVGDCNNKIGGSQFSGEWGRVKGIRKWECGSGNAEVGMRKWECGSGNAEVGIFRLRPALVRLVWLMLLTSRLIIMM
jgi:hypothetical protein